MPTTKHTYLAVRTTFRPGKRLSDEALRTRSFARVAAETAEWLSERVLEDGGVSSRAVATRLRMQARTYRSISR